MRKAAILYFLFFSFKLLSEPVNPEFAKSVAINFLTGKDFKNAAISTPELELYKSALKNSGLNNIYIFNLTNQEGFIIVSADNSTFPILGYSFSNHFDEAYNQPDGFKEWLENSCSQIEFILEKKLPPSPEIRKAWENLAKNNKNVLKNTNEVSPLLSTKWNQGKYYNSLCPLGTGGDNGHVWVGCVAVAMAQVMKYWNYPQYGSSNHSYNCNPYGVQAADFSSTLYDWNAMPNSLNAENMPVATLLYHCGVSVNMGYAPGGSGAFMGSVVTSLKNYFDYSKDVQMAYKFSYTDQGWDSLIRHEMDAGQPVAMAGGSHAFVIDGYKETNYFHVNWGWGGSYDGYYYFSALNPGSSNFTSGQQAVINVRPGCGQSQNSLVTLNNTSGVIFDNGGPVNNYLNCSETKTLISPAGNSKIKLIFNAFKTVQGQDTLYIFDGEDSNAPLLANYTGNLGNFELMSSGPQLYLLFKSNSFNSDSGYAINYISAFDDTGVSGILSPVSKTCGKTDDSIAVVVKNFGINTKSNIPVTVKIKTPKGIETYNKTFAGPLKTFETDTLFVHLINTIAEGNYAITGYTRTTGDNLNRDNDTTKVTTAIKQVATIPFSENVDSLGYDMGDWLDFHQKTWITSEGENGNQFFRTFAGGGETGGIEGRDYGQFLIFNRKIGTVSQFLKLYFDYRIMSWGQIPSPATLNEAEKIKILVSSDCATHFDTVYTINAANHVTSGDFSKATIDLGNYAGQNIIIGFYTEWDANMCMIDYDNFLVVDSAQITGLSVPTDDNYSLQIYPNPAKGIFYIKNQGFKNEKIQLRILDLNGKEMTEMLTEPGKEEWKVDLTSFPDGIYLVELSDGKLKKKGKVLKR
ncbi:MAG: C10 family peptidase [Bacteroidales bacterium]